MSYSLEELNGQLQEYYAQHQNALNTVQQVMGAIMALEAQIKSLIYKMQQEEIKANEAEQEQIRLAKEAEDAAAAQALEPVPYEG